MSAYVCTYTHMDAWTRAHVCTPTHRSDQATWLNLGCSRHKLGDFVEMTPPLWASESSVAHEGSTGTCFLTRLWRMKEVAPKPLS